PATVARGVDDPASGPDAEPCTPPSAKLNTPSFQATAVPRFRRRRGSRWHRLLGTARCKSCTDGAGFAVAGMGIGVARWEYSFDHSFLRNLRRGRFAMRSDPALDKLCIDTIRTLAMDAVQKADSGHAGAPMALAPVAYQ